MIRGIQTVLKILLNYTTSAVATVLPLLLYPLNIIAQIVVSANSKSSVKVASEMAKRDAISIDIFLNEAYKELWQIILFKSGFHAEIGQPNETLSYVIARAWKAGELTWFGYLVGLALVVIFFWEIPKGGYLNVTLRHYDY
jgi:hypothetical protein